MRKGIKLAAVFLVLMFCCAYCLSYAQVTQDTASALQTKTIDVNKDGKPDVVNYYDGKDLAKIEADTNYDGKPDVTVTTENGKFKSAQADTDYDGTPDKKFNSTAEFTEWLNRDKPEFKEALGFSEDGTYTLFTF